MEKLEKAIRQASREISSGFVEGMKGQLEGSDSDLFGLAEVRGPREVGGTGSALERQVLSECQWRGAQGQARETALIDAIEDVLRDRAGSDIRAAEPVMIPEGGRYVIERMRTDLETLDFKSIANEVADGGARQLKGEEALSVDDDLLAPSEGRK
ncbi:MAG: hypothetical protein WAZ27_00405 [Minisyncoccia bacterium]